MKNYLILSTFILCAFVGMAQDPKEQGGKKKNNLLITADASDREVAKNIVNDLITMNVISDTSKVIFILSHGKMEVNNKIQPDGIFEQFKEKYHIVPGYSITHSQSQSTTSTWTVKEN